MKTLFLSLSSLMMLLFFACTKEDGLLSDSSSQADLQKSSHHGGKVIKVTPTGVDDTQALIDAFEAAKAAGPGSTVKLEEGTYTIGMIEVRDFDGNFRGAGKGKTIITNLPELPCEDCWEVNIQPSLISFIGGNVEISDMTLQLKDGEPCAYGPLNDLYIGDLCCGLILADYSSLYVPANRHIKGIIKDVDFIGGNDGGYGVWGTLNNVNMMVYLGANFYFPAEDAPLSNCEIIISGCSFEQCNVGPDAFGFDKNSTLRIENSFITGGMQSIFIGGCMGSKIDIKRNKIINGTWVDIFIDGAEYGYFPDLLPEAPTMITVQGNDIQSPEGVISLYVRDFFRTSGPETVFPYLVNINGNAFSTVEGILDPLFFEIREWATAIQLLDCKDAVILNNMFSGSGTAGVYIDGDEDSETWAENVKLMGNNYFNATYDIASVYLGPFTKDCKVVGVKTDQVVDDGIDNSVIGVKAHKGGNHYGHPHGNAFRTGNQNTMPGRPLPAHK